MSVIEKIKEEDAKTKQKQREIAFNYLFDNAKDKVAVGKVYLFEYDPKTKIQLARWDKYPLVLVTTLYDDGFAGANFHYTTQKQRMILAQKFLNNNVRIPFKLLHRYIIDKKIFTFDRKGYQILYQLLCYKYQYDKNRI